MAFRTGSHVVMLIKSATPAIRALAYLVDICMARRNAQYKLQLTSYMYPTDGSLLQTTPVPQSMSALSAVVASSDLRTSSLPSRRGRFYRSTGSVFNARRSARIPSWSSRDDWQACVGTAPQYSHKFAGRQGASMHALGTRRVAPSRTRRPLLDIP